MSGDRLQDALLNRLINARIDLAVYLRLRRAKGYMSVSESNHLRDNLFDLCNEIRGNVAIGDTHLEPRQREMLNHAAAALSAAAICLMSGHHDCPAFIAVNAEKLENCLTSLALCIQRLRAYSYASLAGA